MLNELKQTQPIHTVTLEDPIEFLRPRRGDSTSSQIERLLILGPHNYVTQPLKPKAPLAVVDDVLDESARSN